MAEVKWVIATRIYTATSVVPSSSSSSYYKKRNVVGGTNGDRGVPSASRLTDDTGHGQKNDVVSVTAIRYSIRMQHCGDDI